MINDNFKPSKGFSFAEALISMLIIGVVAAAALPFITLRETKMGSHQKAEECIVSDGGTTTTEACMQVINDCKHNMGNSCETVIFLAKDQTYSNTAKSVLKETCLGGSEQSCNYFIEQCASDSSQCDISGTDNDLRGLLKINADEVDEGKLYIYKKVKKWFTDQIANIETEVLAACTAHPSSIACKMLSQKEYEFKRYQRDDFIEEDPVNGTTFSNGVLTRVSTEWFHEYQGDMANSIIESGGYLYVTGYENYDNINGGLKDIIIMKINSYNGIVEWKNQYGGHNGGADGNDRGNYIAISNGYLYVAGSEHDSDLDGNERDIIVMKVNAENGVVEWKNQYSGSGDWDTAHSLAIVGNDVYVAGLEDTDPLGGGDDIFVMKLNGADGSVDWINQYGGPLSERSTVSIAVSENNIYITGTERSDPDGGSYDIAVIKLNLDGSMEWKRQYGGSSVDLASSMFVSDDSIYITGSELSEAPTSSYDIFIMKLDKTDGSVEWNKQYGGDENDYGNNITLSDGYLYVTGTESSDPLGGDEDIFVMKLDPSDGTVIWKKQYGSAGSEQGNSLAVSGNFIYVAGKRHIVSFDHDMVIMKINVNQSSSNITNWTIDSSISWGYIDDLDDWTVEGAVSWGLIDDLDGWILDGFLPFTGNTPPQEDEAITNWGTKEGITLDDEIVSDWTVGLSSVTSYYITTTDDNNILDANKLLSIDITQTPDPNDSINIIKYLVSFDNRSNWSKLTGVNCASSQVTTDLSVYDFSGTNANTYDEVESYLANCDISSNGTLDFAVSIQGYPYIVTLDKIIINYY